MKTRPSFINELDWKCLTDKYPNEKKLDKIIAKIEKDYPVQYAIGNVQFLNVTIDVNESVLIPRFETELLVDTLIKYIKKYKLQYPRIIDMCTGSGCIAIALKKTFPESAILGIDKSLRAINVAKRNAKKNKTDIIFKKRDALKSWNLSGKYSVLVSNPPYVQKEEYVTPNTRYEPSMALYPGEDDIIFYKEILKKCPQILYPRNIIAFEIGSGQAERICRYAKKVFPTSHIEVVKDYNDYERFIFIFNSCEESAVQ